MVQRGWRTILAIAGMAALALGQGPARPADVPIHVRAILVDGQLNQKPVPRLELRFATSSGGAAAAVRTDFDGQADIELPPGRYTLTTPAGIAFDGQSYSWRIQFTIKAAPLTLTLSNDDALPPGSRALAELTSPIRTAPAAPNLEAQFRRLRSTVVTVWSDLGHGSGFIVALHPNGMAMLLTNDHVVAGAHYLAVQTDATHKVRAVLLDEDKDRDVAALEANLSAAPAVAAAQIAPGAEVAAEPAGAAVFTIGSPLNQQKVLTAGIIGRNDTHAFISAININHGNSGGPLFAADGRVIGITTFGDVTSSGPGISGIIKITEANTVLRRAEAKFESHPALPLDPLPTVPARAYPLDALKQTVRQRRFDEKPYTFSFAGYDVLVATPPLVYWRQTRGTAALQRVSRRRGSASGPDNNGFDPAADLRNWMQYTGEYAPVVWVEMTPRLKPTLSSLFLHSLTSAYTRDRSGRELRYHFQADFGRMELDCGGSAITPISPGRIPQVDVDGRGQPKDAAFEGLYEYPPGAITPDCGAVRLTVYGAGKGGSPQTHTLSPALVRRIWNDFAPWRAAPSPAP